MENRIEIMAPAGSYESLMGAIQGGAHSVYFGVGKLNMRSRSSKNFSLDDLEKIASICRENGMKSYLALNTIIYDEEMDEVHQTIRCASDAGVSAVIASDVSVMGAARERGMEVHISTQCNITNLAAVKFYSRFADVMVLARELNLVQVRFITDAIAKEGIRGPSGRLVEIEMFVDSVGAEQKIVVHDAEHKMIALDQKERARIGPANLPGFQQNAVQNGVHAPQLSQGRKNVQDTAQVTV